MNDLRKAACWHVNCECIRQPKRRNGYLPRASPDRDKAACHSMANRKRGKLSMIRTIYSSICGALIFIAALIPAAILVMDKTGF